MAATGHDGSGRGSREPERAAEPGQIFVVGRERSGTKWLTNQISSHPEVAAITAEGTGVLEANLFAHMPRMFGDLRIDDHYYAFLAAFMKSSYFHRSGLPESVLFERRHTDYLGFFRFFMDRLAERRGAKHWLQKGSSLQLPQLRAAFPDARFLVMRRAAFENIRSSIVSGGGASSARGKPLLIGRELASYYLHRGIEQAHLGDTRIQLVTYESMKADKERVMRSVCEFLGLEFDPVMLRDAFPPNTSFKRVGRDEVFTPGDVRTFRALKPVVRAMPAVLLRRLHQGWVRPGPRKGERLLISGAFKTFRHEVEAATAEEAGPTPAEPVASSR